MLEPRILKTSARENLPADHKKLTLIHTAAALGISLMVTLLQYYLNQQISAAGGLSGLGTRTILETAQLVLSYGVNLALPFWELGFLFAALRMARGQQTGLTDLLEGFRRFGPALRKLVIQGMLYTGAAVASMYIGAFVFSMTPLASPLMELLAPVLAESMDVTAAQNMLLALPVETLLELFLPFFVIAGILFVALGLMLFYRFRVSDFILMDQPKTGALAALFGSSHMTKGHRRKLLKLDLSFWWFYLLAAVAALIMNADLLLPYLNITLPIPGDASWLVCYALGLAVQLVVYWQFYGHVQATYATAYDTLRQLPAAEPKPQPVPKRLPWDDYSQPQ